MKITQIRELSGEELSTELERLRKRVFELRSQAVTEKLEDPTLITKSRRDIARILTVMNERRGQGESAPAKAQK
ncbi:MAG: 50S ribosomal protein L29 [Planctomycetes bacterium]|nr:50S ribosomal protein L29 [Planctomycetota bacterium]